MNQYIEQPRSETIDIPSILRRFDINPTSQRVEIARIFLAKMQHLSADQVLSKVNKEYARVSKATVYNTLNLFAGKGLVRQVIVDPNKVFYDSNTSEHYHFYNEDTGQLADLDATELEILGIPELPEKTVKSGLDVIVRVRNIK